MLASTAFSFVFANFGIAMAARIPMMTTTIRSSIRVKPLRFCIVLSPWEKTGGAGHAPPWLRQGSVAGRRALGSHRGVRSHTRAHEDAAGLDRALQRGVGRRGRPPTRALPGDRDHVVGRRREGHRARATITV